MALSTGKPPDIDAHFRKRVGEAQRAGAHTRGRKTSRKPTTAPQDDMALRGPAPPAPGPPPRPSQGGGRLRGCGHPMDAGALLGDLEGPRRDGRLPALDRLLQLPRGLRELDPRRLAPALHACLADECPEVRCRSAALVPEALESLHRAAAAPAEAAPPQKAVVASEEAPRGAPLGRAAAAGAQASRHEENWSSLCRRSGTGSRITSGIATSPCARQPGSAWSSTPAPGGPRSASWGGCRARTPAPPRPRWSCGEACWPRQ
ncbi:unnamed protein product, partial [Prorocentrum cordatum]